MANPTGERWNLDYSRIREFAITEHQRRVIDTVVEEQSLRKAAQALGLNISSVCRVLRTVRRYAQARGWSPEHDLTRPVAPTQRLAGASTLYKLPDPGEGGGAVLQWVKSKEDPETIRAMALEVIEALREEIPRAKAVKASPRCSDDLLSCYVITDYHIGALAWGEETRGEDWDAGIAEDLLVKWFEVAVAESPPSQVGLFAQLGDFLHIDNFDALTPAARNRLDADSRYQRVVRVVIRVVQRIVAMMLKKHERVCLIMAEGNHDPASSAWLREAFSAHYASEPRVSVDTSPDPYYVFEWGLTSLFFHHGHLRKMKDVHTTFAAKFREVFGRTKYSYAHLGHYHHERSEETALMVVHQHRTLAAADAYSSRSGYVTGRDAEVITYSKKFGKVGALTISPDRARGVS